MSLNRVCRNCYRGDDIRMNFGYDTASEEAYHKKNWCSCGYSSHEEMMLDQNLGFTDPRWVKIGKNFLNDYYHKIRLHKIMNKDDHMRWFLKLLHSTAENHGLAIHLSTRKPDYNNKTNITAKNPKSNIFEDDHALRYVPDKIVLNTTGLHEKAQKLVKLNKKKNIWMAILISIIILLSLALITKYPTF